MKNKRNNLCHPSTVLRKPINGNGVGDRCVSFVSFVSFYFLVNGGVVSTIIILRYSLRLIRWRGTRYDGGGVHGKDTEKAGSGRVTTGGQARRGMI